MISETFPMTVGEEEVLNEHHLLTKVESGLMMNGADSVRFLIVHCSATRVDCDYTVKQLLHDHKARGFRTIGYHFYITRDGEIHPGRPLEKVGAHCRNHNAHSIGICYEGGLDADGQAKDTRTLAQRGALLALLRELKKKFPEALIIGHHDLNPIKKCPCYPCVEEYREL